MAFRDIFKDGPSPQLQAFWDELDAAIDKFKLSDSAEEKEQLLQKYPQIRHDVICGECGQEL